MRQVAGFCTVPLAEGAIPGALRGLSNSPMTEGRRSADSVEFLVLDPVLIVNAVIQAIGRPWGSFVATFPVRATGPQRLLRGARRSLPGPTDMSLSSK
jgi:hypothetical protein